MGSGGGAGMAAAGGGASFNYGDMLKGLSGIGAGGGGGAPVQSQPLNIPYAQKQQQPASVGLGAYNPDWVDIQKAIKDIVMMYGA